MVRVTPLEKAAYPSKFVPLFKGPRVITERFANGKTYKARDLGSAEERQLTRDQFKVVDLPPPRSTPPEPQATSGAALRDLQVERGDESEPIAWLGSPTPSELAEAESPEPLPPQRQL